MSEGNISILDAALGVFLRYGFRRTTMGDIAQAAGLSRQSLYARFASKDEVYAAGLELYSQRVIDQLKTAWSADLPLSEAMDAFAEISIIPTFQMLRDNPDAADMIEGAASPVGMVAMARVTQNKANALAELFAPHAKALEKHGLNPQQLAEFVEAHKQAMAHRTETRAHLNAQIATLKASVLALTS